MRTNLLLPITSENGTFVQFQNYADDLQTQSVYPDTWRVVPSKFATVKLGGTYNASTLQYDNLSAASSKTFTNIGSGDSISSGTGIPDLIQGSFNNYYAYMRSCPEAFTNYSVDNTSGTITRNDSEKLTYNPNYTKSLFWGMMVQHGLLGIPTLLDDGTYTFPGINYMGDINIQSAKTENGITSGETYVYIPSTAKEHKYSFSTVEDVSLFTAEYDYRDDENNLVNYGWAANYPENSLLDNTVYCNLYDYNLQEVSTTKNFITVGQWYNMYPTETSEETTADSFVFNAVIVFYDIESTVNGVTTTLYSGIPMGIYFTGLIDNLGTFSGVTKNVSNGDIGGLGTAWSVRICQQQTILQNMNYQSETVSTETDDNLDDYTSVLKAYGELAAQVQELLTKNADNYNQYTKLFANFQNNRVNVPYLVKINDTVSEWYVNGTPTGGYAFSKEYVNKILGA